MMPAPRSRPTLGLIVPPAHGRVPDDAARLYGERACFLARGLGIESISSQGFEPVMHRIVEAAVELRDEGAEAISLMGTSISFHRGAAFTEELRQRMQDATGLPCTTMSHAIVRALRALGVSRVAVATSYVAELNEQLQAYLEASGFEVCAILGLSITGVEAVGDVSTQTLYELALEVHDAAPHADGVLISCGGLQTLDALRQLEDTLRKPAIASSPAGFWDLMRVAGGDPAAPGHGRLFGIGAAA